MEIKLLIVGSTLLCPLWLAGSCAVPPDRQSIWLCTMEIKLLMVGSTLLNRAVPTVAGWKLSCPSRQAEQGMWSCLVAVAAQGVWHSQGALGSAPSWMHIFHWSVKTAAICPKCVCVVYWKVLPVPTGVWWGFAASEVWNARFGVALPGCQALQRPIPSSGLVSHPCLLKLVLPV